MASAVGQPSWEPASCFLSWTVSVLGSGSEEIEAPSEQSPGSSCADHYFLFLHSMVHRDSESRRCSGES